MRGEGIHVGSEWKKEKGETGEELEVWSKRGFECSGPEHASWFEACIGWYKVK